MKASERTELLRTLEARFTKHMRRHTGLVWTDVAARLERSASAMKSLAGMEASGGEPDVIGYDEDAAQFIFCDCSAETPTGRRSLCYDDAALRARKENKPAGSAVAMADAMGAELLTEAEYRELQCLGEFDRKTSSWIATPSAIRSLGGALFCDRRYDTVFVYHNGAESYYAARGFRARLRV